MTKQSNNYTDEDGNTMDPFQEVLRVMTRDHLLVFRKRLESIKRKEMVALFSQELESRTGEAAHPEVEQALLKEAREHAAQEHEKKKKKSKK